MDRREYSMFSILLVNPCPNLGKHSTLFKGPLSWIFTAILCILAKTVTRQTEAIRKSCSGIILALHCKIYGKQNP